MSDERVITVERTVRKRNRVVFVGIVGTLCVCMASVVGFFLARLGCIDDTTARELAYCGASGHSSDASVVLSQLLIGVGPPVLVVVAGVVGAKRCRYWPAVVATTALVPLTVLLDLVSG